MSPRDRAYLLALVVAHLAAPPDSFEEDTLVEVFQAACKRLDIDGDDTYAKLFNEADKGLPKAVRS